MSGYCTLTNSGRLAYHLLALKLKKGVVFVLKTPSVVEGRSWAFKLFTLLLTAFLLLLYSVPAFAIPMRYYLVNQDLDENPWPHARKYASCYYVVISLPSGNFILLPIFVKSKASSEKSSDAKTSGSPRLDEYAQ